MSRFGLPTLPPVPRPCRAATLVAALTLVTACTSGSPKSAPGLPPVPLAFTVSGVEVQSVSQPAPPLPDEVRAKVMATLDAYLDRATAVPLRTGSGAGDLAGLFTSAASARLNGPDRPALVDEGLPRAAGVQAVASTARLGALAGSDNAVSVVAATIDLRLQSTGDDQLTIARSGDLVLVPDGGTWKIDGYDLSTARDSGGGGPTTTTARK